MQNNINEILKNINEISATRHSDLNKQLNQLSKTIIYFLGEHSKEVVAIKQLKRDASLLKATIKTLGFSGDMLEEVAE